LNNVSRLCHAWDHEQYCEAVGVEIIRFADAVKGAQPSMPVPTCPGWTIGKLVKHIGGIHRWAGRMVHERASTRLDPREVELGLPTDEAQYADWLADGAAPLVATLRAADPDAPMWAWGADQHARFWSRRMLHETTVHRADAELALGREPTIDAPVAVDGIDELLDNLPGAKYFAPNVTELRGDGELLHFHCTDIEGEWMIRLSREGFDWEHGHGAASAAVRGAAADLLLLAYGRRQPDEARFERFGEGALLARWLEKSAL
jgi:uncharacterized protein (TIGR03083 family)